MRNFAAAASPSFWPQDANITDLMADMGVRMTFARDEEIFAQEEDADLVYRLVSGSLRTTRLLSDGRRQIDDFYYPGEFFGLEVGPVHRFSAEALSDCTVVVLKRSAFNAMIEKDRALERAYWAAMAKALDRAQTHVVLLGRKNACEKVASFLMEMADRQKTESVDLPMGRQDMADYLGLTIETVSRMLSQLQTASIVRFTDTRQFRISNPDALARLCE